MMNKILLVLLSCCFLLAGCGLSGGGVVTAGDVLDVNKDADIFKYKGRIYSNATELGWFEKEKSKFQKGVKIGDIKKVQTTSFLFGNLSATKLSKGTALYNTDDAKEGIRPGVILVETASGELLYYLEQISE
jgi:hypothetical protein